MCCLAMFGSRDVSLVGDPVQSWRSYDPCPTPVQAQENKLSKPSSSVLPSHFNKLLLTLMEPSAEVVAASRPEEREVLVTLEIFDTLTYHHS